MLLLKKNLVLDNTNNVSNISVQGKINFFDLNNNLYCLNAYYLQNFYKIKQKKTKKNKKKNIVRYSKKKKSQVSIYFKHKNLCRTFKYLKIKNYKNFVKSQYIDFYLSNFVFSKFNIFLNLDSEKHIFSRSYGKTYILLIEKLFGKHKNVGSYSVHLNSINTYNFFYSYICEYSYNLNLHPIFVLPLYYQSNENSNTSYDFELNYTNFFISHALIFSASNIIYF